VRRRNRLRRGWWWWLWRLRWMPWSQ
jgi:hypothetical protein